MTLNPLELAACAGRLAGAVWDCLIPRDEPARALDDDLDFDEAAAEKYLHDQALEMVEPWHGRAVQSEPIMPGSAFVKGTLLSPAVSEAPSVRAPAADGPAVAADSRSSGAAGHPLLLEPADLRSASNMLRGWAAGILCNDPAAAENLAHRLAVEADGTDAARARLNVILNRSR